MKLMRCADYPTLPWKNGGGVTQEVVRMPAGAQAFDWRMSVAQIGRSGPFSDFSGYSRFMVLLAGAGIRLRGAGKADLLLRTPGELIRFDGALPLQCDLLDGACTDLNLMVAQGLGETDVHVATLADPLLLPVVAIRPRLLFCISGMIHIGTANGESGTLLPRDSALSDPADGPLQCRRVGDATVEAAAPLLFVASLPPAG